MSLVSERHLKTVVINMHKPYFIFKTCVMSWLWMCHVSLMNTLSSKECSLCYKGECYKWKQMALKALYWHDHL